MRRLLLLAIAVTFTGCARPGDHLISQNCSWVEEDNRSLNLEKAEDRRHLRYDAVTAEDVAIRWADKYVGHVPDYERRRDECMEALFLDLSSHHGVDVAFVRQFRLERDIVVDSVVILSFGVLYAVAAYILAGRIRQRFPPGEPGFWVMTLTMSPGIALVGLIVGNVWSIIIETFRLNSAHLSYRMDRIPLRQHGVALFVCSLLVFIMAGVIRSRVSIRVKRSRCYQASGMWSQKLAS